MSSRKDSERESTGKRLYTQWNINNNAIRLLMLAMLLILLSTNVSALLASGGSTSMTSSFGKMDINATGASDTSIGASYIASGVFSGSGVSGYLGFHSDTPGHGTLNVTLVSPDDNSGTINSSMTFVFDVNASNTPINCSLYLDGVINSTDYSVSNGNNAVSLDNLGIGNHYWNVSCYDNETYFVSTSVQNFTVLHFEGFDEGSTDLSQVDIHAVPNFTVSKSGLGKISFSSDTDLSGGADLDSNIQISDKTIHINSAALPMLNKSATLTLSNVNYQNILILKDGAICTSCNIISNSGGTLVFGVTSFSTYVVTSTSTLGVFDDTDTVIKFAGNQVYFYANYTNTTSGQPVSGTCNITINSSAVQNMAYNASSKLYYYNTSFNNPGSLPFNVSCAPSNSAFDALSASDVAVITVFDTSKFANIKAATVSSSSYTGSGPTVLNASAGNLTELTTHLNFNTEAWQGYYGRVVGQIVLDDPNGNNLYNWTAASPTGKIYAVRSISVDWPNVGCANIPSISHEDTALGIHPTDADSLDNTFFNTTPIPAFYVGSILINSSRDCYATKLYNATSQPGDFTEVLLSDNNQMIYTSLISPNSLGFDNSGHDFEMIVGENGHLGDTAPTTYYFYLEMT